MAEDPAAAKPTKQAAERQHIPWSGAAAARFAWTILSGFVAESLVFGLAVLPAALFWQWHFTWPIGSPWLRIVLLAMSFLPDVPALRGDA